MNTIAELKSALKEICAKREMGFVTELEFVCQVLNLMETAGMPTLAITKQIDAALADVASSLHDELSCNRD